MNVKLSTYALALAGLVLHAATYAVLTVGVEGYLHPADPAAPAPPAIPSPVAQAAGAYHSAEVAAYTSAAAQARAGTLKIEGLPQALAASKTPAAQALADAITAAPDLAGALGETAAVLASTPGPLPPSPQPAPTPQPAPQPTPNPSAREALSAAVAADSALTAALSQLNDALPDAIAVGAELEQARKDLAEIQGTVDNLRSELAK